MKKSVIMAVTLAGFAVTGLAQETMETTESSESSFYLKFDFGAAFQDSSDGELLGFAGDLETDTGIRFAVAGGMPLNDTVSLEVESGFVFNTFDTFGGASFPAGTEYNLVQIPLLLNVIFTLPTDGPLKPYAGAGVGGVLMGISGDETDSDITYGWQLQAGLNYQFSDNLQAGLGYKLLGTGESELGSAPGGSFITLDSVMTHAVFASIRLDF